MFTSNSTSTLTTSLQTSSFTTDLYQSPYFNDPVTTTLSTSSSLPTESIQTLSDLSSNSSSHSDPRAWGGEGGDGPW